MSITTHGTYARLVVDTANPAHEVADEIVRFVVDLETGTEPGVIFRVIAGLDVMARRIEMGDPEIERIKSATGEPEPGRTAVNPTRNVDLFDADPDCAHEITDAPGGGVKCTKCSGWYCL